MTDSGVYIDKVGHLPGAETHALFAPDESVIIQGSFSECYRAGRMIEAFTRDDPAFERSYTFKEAVTAVQELRRMEIAARGA